MNFVSKKKIILSCFFLFIWALKRKYPVIPKCINKLNLEPLNKSILKSLPTVMKKGVALVIDNHII